MQVRDSFFSRLIISIVKNATNLQSLKFCELFNIWNGTENIFKTALILGYFRLKSLNFGPKSGLKSLIFSSHWKWEALWTALSQRAGGWWWKWRLSWEIHIFCNNLDPAHRIQTKFGMDILLDPWNKPAKEFFIFLKIQDGRRRSKICDALYSDQGYCLSSCISPRYTFSMFL